MLDSYAATLCMLFCAAILQATYVLEERVGDMFLAKYRLYENPKRAMLAFCQQESKVRLFDCPLSFRWHQDKKWQEVCQTPRNRWFFPPRYYELVLQCKVSKLALKGLRTEWMLFY